MEHGKSSARTLALLQKIIDPLAYRMIGCHQDRDILGVVQASGLKITRVERSLAGIMYFIWIKP
jgi:hypothetical protein